MGGVVIRPARASDWPGIETLLTANGLPVAGAREHLQSYWIALDGENVVGTIGLEVHDAHALLRSVAVSPASHWSGIGRALVEHAVVGAAERGIASLHLLTTTAERYFERYGFVVVDRATVPTALRGSVEFVDACPASATCMSRRLP